MVHTVSIRAELHGGVNLLQFVSVADEKMPTGHQWVKVSYDDGRVVVFVAESVRERALECYQRAANPVHVLA